MAISARIVSLNHQVIEEVVTFQTAEEHDDYETATLTIASQTVTAPLNSVPNPFVYVKTASFDFGNSLAAGYYGIVKLVLHSPRAGDKEIKASHPVIVLEETPLAPDSKVSKSTNGKGKSRASKGKK